MKYKGKMVMRMNVLKYTVPLFVLLALCNACRKELQDSSAGEFTRIIPYSAMVSQGPLTRASVNGPLGEDCYVFETGDRLFVEYRDGETLKLYGVLALISGAGSGTGRFEGELHYQDSFEPSEETVLSATLVGPDAAEGFFSFTDVSGGPGTDLVSGVSYPNSVEYAELSTLVRRYSHFTGTSTFAAKNFGNLTQQSVFLNFDVDFYKNKLATPSATNVSLTIKDGGSIMHTVSGVPVLGSDNTDGTVSCWTVLAPGTEVHGYEIFVDQIHCTPDFSADLVALAANNYYHIARSTRDDFTIEAKEENTTIWFQHTGYGIQYRKSGVATWTSYDSTTGIEIDAGECLYFRGKKSTYSSNMFTSNQPVFIYGDIMSLMCDPEETTYYTRKTEVASNGFKEAFKNNSSIDIPSKKELFLSATTLNASCYYQMFYNCSKLSSIPDFPCDPNVTYTLSAGADKNSVCYQMFFRCDSLTTLEGKKLFNSNTSLEAFCFQDMFSECKNLETVPEDFLPATTLAESCYRGMFQQTAITKAPLLLVETLSWNDCYRYMFYGCKKLAYIKCLAKNPGPTYTLNFTGGGVASSGTFVKNAAMTTTWPTGANGIPSGWTVE